MINTAGAWRRIDRIRRSLWWRLVLLTLVFLIVPVLLYQQFAAADAQRRALLMASLRAEGNLVARALTPRILASPGPTPQLTQDLESLVQGEMRVRLLYRPAGAQHFYLIAVSPPLPSAKLEQERDQLAAAGLLPQLGASCQGQQDAQVGRYVNPFDHNELLTSLVPVTNGDACWIVITSHFTGEQGESDPLRPFSRSRELRWAAAIYLAMAVLTFFLFGTVMGALQRFAAAARQIRAKTPGGATFHAVNSIPELTPVALELDRMVGALRGSARAMRQAAEETAHAYKTPLAAIGQSLEPLKRAVPETDDRARRALAIIGRAVDRLSALVAAARRMDEAEADLLSPERQPVDLSTLARRTANAYAAQAQASDRALVYEGTPKLVVLAGEEMLETVLENLLDNALDFAPAGSVVRMSLARDRDDVVLTVADRGRGVAPENLDRIFERYFSFRPDSAPLGEDEPGHFGMGLWIVKRNIDSLGGTVEAVNRADGGLKIVITLPLGG